VLAGFEVPRLDLATQVQLLLCVQKGDFVDLDEIRFQTAFRGNGTSSVGVR